MSTADKLPRIRANLREELGREPTLNECAACRGGKFRQGPPCSWCGATGTVILSPSQRIVFDRLRSWGATHGRGEPHVQAQNAFKSQGLHTSLRSSAAWRGAPKVLRTKPHWMLGRVCEGLDAAEMESLVRSVCWLEDRGL